MPRYITLLWVLLAITAAVSNQPFIPGSAAQENGNCMETRLAVGERGQVLPGQPNNIRAQPTTQSQILGQIAGGSFFRVMDGPVCVEEIAWWQVQQGDLIGWTAEGADDGYWLEPLPRITPENVAQLAQFATLGRAGGFIDWLPNHHTLAMTSGGGVQLLDGANPLALARQIDLARPGSVAISQDGTRIATARSYMCYPDENTTCRADANWIRVWDVATGELRHVLKGHTGGISELSFSSDGALLRSFSWEDGVLVWDLTTEERLISPTGYAHVLEFNQAGHLYVVDEAGYVWLWDTRAGRVVADTPVLGPVAGDKFIFSPDQTHLIGVRSQGDFTLWDLRDGSMRHTTTDLHETYAGVDWAQGWIITQEAGQGAGTLIIRHLASFEPVHTFPLTGEEDGPLRYHFGWITRVIFSADHRLMAVQANYDWCDGWLGVWDVVTGEAVLYWERGCASLAFQPETNNLLIAHPDGLFEWNASTRSMRTLSLGIRIFTTVEFSASDNLLVAADSVGRIHAWDASNWTELAGTHGYNRLFAVHPAGQMLAYLGRNESTQSWGGVANHGLYLWNPWTGHNEQAFTYADNVAIYAVAFDTNGTVLGAMGGDTTHTPQAQLWNIAAKQVLPASDQARYPQLITELEQKSIGWQLPRLESLPETYRSWSRTAPQPPVFSPDGSLLLARCDGDTICLLDAQSGTWVQTLEPVADAISSAAFSPDGQLLAATTGEFGNQVAGQLVVWDTTSGKLVAAPDGHMGAAWDVAFSPDGTVIATAGGGCYECEGWGWDNVIRLWRVPPN